MSRHCETVLIQGLRLFRLNSCLYYLRVAYKRGRKARDFSNRTEKVHSSSIYKLILHPYKILGKPFCLKKEFGPMEQSFHYQQHLFSIQTKVQEKWKLSPVIMWRETFRANSYCTIHFVATLILFLSNFFVP